MLKRLRCVQLVARRIYLHARDLSLLEPLGPCGGLWATPNPQPPTFFWYYVIAAK